MDRINVECRSVGVKRPPKNISDATQKQRMDMYEMGGVYFISAQVLILGMVFRNLKKKMKNFKFLNTEPVLKTC